MSKLNPFENKDFFDPADIFGGRRARESIESAERLALRSEAIQRDWLDYIKQTQEPYLEVGERALRRQEDLLPGILGGVDYEAARTSPEYQTLRDVGEEAVLRHGSATGRLRTPGTREELAGLNQQLLTQVADKEYQRKLSGFNILGALSGRGQAGAQTLGAQGLGATGEITGTYGQLAQLGITGAQQQQQSNQSLLGLAALAAFSDIDLKDDITKIKSTNHPSINIYRWNWNKKANEIGLRGKAEGYLVQEVEKIYPNMVTTHNTGYKQVNIDALEKRLD